MNNSTTWGQAAGVGEYDATQASEFLNALHASQRGDIVLCVYGARKEQYPLSIANFDQWTPFLQQHVAQGSNIYTTVCQFDPARETGRNTRKQAHAVSVPGVWADLDTKDATAEQLEDLLRLLPPATILVDSGSGGRHAYWLFNEPLTDVARAKALTKSWLVYMRSLTNIKIDAVQDLSRILRLPGTVRTKGGPATRVQLLRTDGPRYAVSDLERLAPPAVVKDITIGDFSIEVNAERMTGYVISAVSMEAKELAAVTSERNSALNKAAFKLGTLGAHNVLSEETAYEALRVAYEANGGMHDPDNGGIPQFEATFASGWTAGLEHPRDLSGVRMLQPDNDPAYFQKNDHGNAQRLAHYFGDSFRYIKDISEWMLWDGRRWEIATRGQLMWVAHEVCRQMYVEAATFNDQTDRDNHAKWAHKSYAVSSCKNMLEAATGLQELWSRSTEFDQKTFLLNVANGTVDLRTGELLEHDPKNMLTGLSDTKYDPEATAPRWMAMVARSVRDAASVDPALVPYLQKVFGYMLFGDNIEEKVFFAIGAAQCGKSKLGEIIGSVLGGDYAQTAKTELVAKGRNGHHDSETYSLIGKRVVTISETSATFGLDENQLKMLTGESTIPVRKLRDAKERQVPRTWTILLASNNNPNVSDWDAAMARRVVKIPFGPTVPTEERDGGLPSYIKQNEAEGVLAWLVQGAVAWYHDWSTAAQSTGLAMPLSVQMSTQAYADESDHIGTFIEEMVDLGEGYSISRSEALNRFTEWAKRNEKAVNRNQFYARLGELEGVSVHRNREFRGLRVRTTSEISSEQQDWVDGQS
jgi:P4 family phage/plasmid primase-like protien